LIYSKYCLYHRKDVPLTDMMVRYESSPKFISDPFSYEQEHKHRNVWSVKDIECFLQQLLEHPKNFWAAAKKLPHKTTKEVVYFFYAFKKLFNLKKHFKTCIILNNLPTQKVMCQAIQDIINEIMRPLVLHQQKGRTASLDVNQAIAQACSGANQ